MTAETDARCLSDGEPGAASLLVCDFRGVYYETLETSTYDVQRPADRRSAGGLRQPGRCTAGDAGSAYRRTHARSTDGDPCANHRRESHRNRSSATCNASIARFGGTNA